MGDIVFGGGSVVSIGECMVELARGSDGRFGLAVGGDTFNTAVYLARCGVDVAYLTRLGDDPYSDAIIEAGHREGVRTADIPRVAGRMPGLYLIETSQAGERTFWYWRDRAPARELFDGEDAPTAAAVIAGAGVIYFSGVTLSLYSEGGLERFEAALSAARANGARVVMDSNYRPRGWGSDTARARSVFKRFWSLADVALPTFDDEQALWGDGTPQATAERLAALGPAEIAVKSGAEGALISTSAGARHVPCPAVVKALDTTAAGDSFNAAYLAARLGGRTPFDAAAAGHALAGVVIQHRGAIVPRAATQAVAATIVR
jgi:2-dehydro-3-deoxygluconokinase